MWQTLLTLFWLIAFAPFRPLGALPARVLMPIEVLGEDGTTVSRILDLSLDQSKSVRSMWLRVHGVRYDDQASMQVNGSGWIPLRNDTAAIADPGKQFGGIGGGFSTLELTVHVPPGTLVSGRNTVQFRFNRSDGFASGYRILALNFLAEDGSRVLSPSAFAEDEPETWLPPRPDDASIRAGRELWFHAPLRASSVEDSPRIRARCADCHARDGRDLKYFNFSNASIIARSRFHGLTNVEGEQIASYIRSLPFSNPGRPWNPPYQPGPGTDGKPAGNWAAGAGLEWVLDDDVQALPYLIDARRRSSPAPTYRPAVEALDMRALVRSIRPDVFLPDGDLDAHEVPIALQLPDWSHWLPRIHPMDAWGPEFDRSQFARMYGCTDKGPGKDSLHPQPATAKDCKGDQFPAMQAFVRWSRARRAFLSQYVNAKTSWSPELSEKVYSTQLWQLLKTWEMTQESGLEERGTSVELRTWCNTIPAETAPDTTHIPDGPSGVGGSALTNEYLSASWYELQIILNSGGHQHRDRTPVDWIYVIDHFRDFHLLSHRAEPARLLVAVTKALQSTDPSLGPDDMSRGWQPDQNVDPRILVSPRWEPEFKALPADVRQAITEAMLSAWMDKNLQFPLVKYLPIPPPQRAYIPAPGYDDISGGKVWQAAARFRAAGVSDDVVLRLERWGEAYTDRAMRLQYH
jgi:hypothetical protein